MVHYTADAVALLVYLVDALPRRADRLFAGAEAAACRTISLNDVQKNE